MLGSQTDQKITAHWIRKNAPSKLLNYCFLDGLPLTYSMYGADKSCYDFDDDIDELFDLANYLIETNPLAEPKEVDIYN